MNRSWWAAGLAACVLSAPTAGSAQTYDDARSSWRSGEYEDALDAYRALTRQADAPPQIHIDYVSALLEVGRYGDALRAAEAGPTDATHNVRGEVLYAVGRIDDAEAAFEAALEAGRRDRNVALLNLGVLLWNRGERDRGLEIFDTFIDLYNGSDRLTPDDLMAVGLAVQYMGIESSALFQDALLAFDNAATIDPNDPRVAILTGELFLQKYLSSEAYPEFAKVLQRNPKHPRALLGRARTLSFDGNGQAMATVIQALDTNPFYPDALALRARLLLKTENFEDARDVARQALEVNPNHLDALSVLAAAHYLRGETTEYETVRQRALQANPRYADLYNTVAELAIDHRKYQDAVDLAKLAVTVDSTSWRGWGILGQNQMRTREIEAGGQALQRAFDGDPYNPWFKNGLDLLDTFDRYVTIETEHFELFIDGSEADLIAPYATELAERAYDDLVQRYQTEPPLPIRVEFFPSHADFSVRTLGLVGLGALGVTFGSTVVMDSPSAREAGEFNWASVFWHELAHVFHLGMTDHNVPRWFSEGLAVHEQRTAEARWGHQPSPAWLRAYRTGRLNPVSQMNEGFVRPTYPEQVPFSYYQASLVFQLIEDQWGFGAVLGMLRGYREGRTTNELIPEVLGQNLDQFDETFDDFINEMFGEQMDAVEPILDDAPPGRPSFEFLQQRVVDNPGSFQARIALGRALFLDDNHEAAEEELLVALNLFPEYGGPDSHYLYLARISRARGDLEAAADYLFQLGQRNENLFQIHVDAADILDELGRHGESAQALERAVEVFPYDVELHKRLAEILGDLGRHETAVLERSAVLALDPVDKADAHYQLARSQWLSGDARSARSSVLRALEIAPTFQDALELLLEIRGGAR